MSNWNTASITSPGPAGLLHSQLWSSWHCWNNVQLFTSCAARRFFLPAPQLYIILNWPLFADLSKKRRTARWDFCVIIKVKIYGKNIFLHLPREVCSLLCKRGAAAVGCRADLVSVTLIKTVCSSYRGRTNAECDPLPSLCHTMDLQNWESCSVSFWVHIYDTHAHTLPLSQFYCTQLYRPRWKAQTHSFVFSWLQRLAPAGLIYSQKILSVVPAWSTVLSVRR